MRGIRILFIVFPLVTAGCTGSPSAQAPEAPPEALVWPASLAGPHIRYVRSFSGAHDAGIAKSFIKRMIEAVIGKSEARLVRPTGVAEHEGVIYIADPGAQAVWIFDSARQRFTKVTRMGNVTLVSPVAVAAGPEGRVYVADSGLKKVFLLDPERGTLRAIVEQGLKRPAAVVMDPATGRVYVADSADHRILVYEPDGAQVRSWGKRGSGNGEFNYPTHLAWDRAGALLVTDALNFRIQAFDRDGRFLWKIGRHGDGSGDLAAPKGVATDSQGHLYIVDALFDAVQIFEQRNSTLLLSFGERGVGHGKFWLPAGIYISKTDRIFVADAYNRRIQVFDFLADPKEVSKTNTP